MLNKFKIVRVNNHNQIDGYLGWSGGAAHIFAKSDERAEWYVSYDADGIKLFNDEAQKYLAGNTSDGTLFFTEDSEAEGTEWKFTNFVKSISIGDQMLFRNIGPDYDARRMLIDHDAGALGLTSLDYYEDLETDPHPFWNFYSRPSTGSSTNKYEIMNGDWYFQCDAHNVFTAHEDHSTSEVDWILDDIGSGLFRFKCIESSNWLKVDVATGEYSQTDVEDEASILHFYDWFRSTPLISTSTNNHDFKSKVLRVLNTSGDLYDAITPVEAENGTVVSGSVVMDNEASGITYIDGISTGDMVKFTVNFRDGADRLVFHQKFASSSNDPLLIRLDSPTGKIIGQLKPSLVLSHPFFKYVESPIDYTTGTHDIYMSSAGHSSDVGIDYLFPFNANRLKIDEEQFRVLKKNSASTGVELAGDNAGSLFEITAADDITSFALKESSSQKYVGCLAGRADLELAYPYSGSDFMHWKINEARKPGIVGNDEHQIQCQKDEGIVQLAGNTLDGRVQLNTQTVGPDDSFWQLDRVSVREGDRVRFKLSNGRYLSSVSGASSVEGTKSLGDDGVFWELIQNDDGTYKIYNRNIESSPRYLIGTSGRAITHEDKNSSGSNWEISFSGEMAFIKCVKSGEFTWLSFDESTNAIVLSRFKDSNVADWSIQKKSPASMKEILYVIGNGFGDREEYYAEERNSLVTALKAVCTFDFFITSKFENQISKHTDLSMYDLIVYHNGTNKNGTRPSLTAIESIIRNHREHDVPLYWVGRYLGEMLDEYSASDDYRDQLDENPYLLDIAQYGEYFLIHRNSSTINGSEEPIKAWANKHIPNLSYSFGSFTYNEKFTPAVRFDASVQSVFATDYREELILAKVNNRGVKIMTQMTDLNGEYFDTAAKANEIVYRNIMWLLHDAAPVKSKVTISSAVGGDIYLNGYFTGITKTASENVELVLPHRGVHDIGFSGDNERFGWEFVVADGSNKSVTFDENWIQPKEWNVKVGFVSQGKLGSYIDPIEMTQNMKDSLKAQVQYVYDDLVAPHSHGLVKWNITYEDAADIGELVERDEKEIVKTYYPDPDSYMSDSDKEDYDLTIYLHKFWFYLDKAHVVGPSLRLLSSQDDQHIVACDLGKTNDLSVRESYSSRGGSYHKESWHFREKDDGQYAIEIMDLAGVSQGFLASNSSGMAPELSELENVNTVWEIEEAQGIAQKFILKNVSKQRYLFRISGSDNLSLTINDPRISKNSDGIWYLALKTDVNPVARGWAITDDTDGWMWSHGDKRRSQLQHEVGHIYGSLFNDKGYNIGYDDVHGLDNYDFYDTKSHTRIGYEGVHYDEPDATVYFEDYFKGKLYENGAYYGTSPIGLLFHGRLKSSPALAGGRGEMLMVYGDRHSSVLNADALIVNPMDGSIEMETRNIPTFEGRKALRRLYGDQGLRVTVNNTKGESYFSNETPLNLTLFESGTLKFLVKSSMDCKVFVGWSGGSSKGKSYLDIGKYGAIIDRFSVVEIPVKDFKISDIANVTIPFGITGCSDNGEMWVDEIRYVEDVNNSSDNEAPTRPKNATVVEVGASSAIIAWGASVDNVGVEAYIIQSSSFNGTVTHGSTSDLIFTVTDLVHGMNSNISVIAVDAAGNFSEPTVVSVTPMLKESIYEMVNVNSGKCIDVLRGGTANATNVQQYDCNGTNGQQWSLEYSINGSIAFKNVNADKYLDIANGGALSNIQIWYNDLPGRSQRWNVRINDDGSYTFESVIVPGKCIDVQGASSANYANIQVYSCNGTTAQRFTLNEVFGPGSDEFRDLRDNKVYKKVTIGNQIWMAENLNYSADNAIGYCSGESNKNDAATCDTYGRLYNWYEAMDGDASTSANPSNAQGLCPESWHVPSNAEWQELIGYVSVNNLGAEVGQSLKSTTHWDANTSGGPGTDLFGFSALPGGFGGNNGSGYFNSLNKYGLFWSATMNGSKVLRTDMRYNDNGVHYDNSGPNWMVSVRCVSDEEPETTFTDSRDGQIYEKVTIGTQIWMAENLNYSADNTVGFCHGQTNYSDAATCDTYGRMYTWNEAMNGDTESSTSPSEKQGLCPANWHLPSHGEWKQLVAYVVANNSTVAVGQSLKAATLWNADPAGGPGTDTYGFSALAAGFGNTNGSSYYSSLNKYGLHWSTTKSGSSVRRTDLRFSDNAISYDNSGTGWRLSARCIENE
ncbi:MAG: RICIN domain-containing protein [Fibrobacterales bacterium]